ncbi:putative DNA double-strand break repair Rad50 ATPase [Candidatus Thermoflexus japonica]|uniref:Nuclease SbcCD subunit C n=1 Tax=Candidatus Thermoflexus japonica TaxID=2035417 RepID=A0A2H5Y9L4_9CHLR|nr:putative DNA double-strand break repair Rad50 ATPase [Candidatus Thermoflexus japonica]
MELVRLELKNFLSYREGELDFTGLHMAALVGPNGAGKSSLLDAITWALWGRTSRLDRDQDHLVHRGEKEARVSLTFRLGEAVYRVTRVRRRGKGNIMLDFQMLVPRHRVLSGAGIRETQEEINKVLQIDFDTFVNSAFIRQGRADEFTTKTPAERKEVLAEILRLDQWRELEERAKEKIREIDARLDNLKWRMEEHERELQQRPEYEAAFQRASMEHLDRQVEREAAEREWEALRRDEERAQAVRDRLRELEGEREQVERHLARLEEQIARLQESLSRWRALTGRREAILAAWEELQRAREALARLEEASREAHALQARRAELETQIAVARARMEGERRRLQEEIEAITARAARQSELEAEAADIRRQISERPALEEEIRALREQLQALQAERGERQNENRQLYQEMKDLEARIQAISRIGAECPTCRRPLPEAERMRLQREWELEGRRRGDRYRENQARLQAIDQEQSQLEARLQERQLALETLSRLELRMEQIEQELREIHGELDRLEERRRALQELDQRLQEDRVAPEEQAALQEIDAALKALGYDIEAHHALLRRVRELEEAGQEWHRLQEAERRIPEEEEALHRLEEIRRGELERRHRLQEEQGRLEREKEDLEGRLKALPEAQRRVEAARRAEREARDRMIAAKQRLENCDRLAEELAQMRKEKIQLEEEKGLYRDLQIAFGRNGIPAMIIEAILPEIEEEANRILQRLTDGRLTVRFRSQRETKSGTVQETLDILISDEGEERPYENFSGGEKFRVDFAIRLALSRVLARRSGTPLRLLVVDEGFGSQDQAGRERLIEALNAVKDEFSTVLVISHLEEFQDAFPVRIEVRKTANGSQLQLVM